ncbi:hypothetical protein FE257_006418 [Aspergillus nanangensis]|uniref:Enoyl reductase (ER) domain-containing protein n=1 Tax=Aspergillus nanangensis TaxID=2582783 RepID=A0AAD4CY04_ASPNN|nr:hypothetical protein FE257_006418 [Aspergillus nanangensis]
MPRAIVSHGSYKSHNWKLENVNLRPLQENELLIEIVASGICQTDLHFAGAESGFGIHYPRVMGHEGAGYVLAIGPNTTVAQINDPVILSFSGCKTCEPCQQAHPAHCSNFNAINFDVDWDNTHVFEAETATPIYGKFFGQSSFGSRTIVRADSVINVAGQVQSRAELQLMAPLGCGIQTGSGAILNAAGARAQDRVAVLGLGGVGLSAVMGAKIAGCRQVIGIDRHASRLGVAKELGATDVVCVSAEEDLGAVSAAVMGLTGGLGVNVVLDTTGVPGLIAQGVKMAACKGKILQVGTAPETATLEIPIHEFMVSGKQFMGVVEGDVVPREYVPKLVDWVRDGTLPLAKIVKFYPAEEFEKAIADMQSGETIKPVILW